MRTGNSVQVQEEDEDKEGGERKGGDYKGSEKL